MCIPINRNIDTGVMLHNILNVMSRMVPTDFVGSEPHWYKPGLEMVLCVQDARHFHQLLKDGCDEHDKEYYPAFKKWCDEYFFLKHRCVRRHPLRGLSSIG